MVGIDESRPFLPVNIAILTISDSRTLETDKSGQILVERLQAAGHQLLERRLVPDERETIVAVLWEWVKHPQVDVVITTGGRELPVEM